MKKNTLLIILAIAALVAGFILIINRNKAKNEAEVASVAKTNDAIAVRVAAASMTGQSNEFRVNGTFIPQTQTQVSAEMGGQLVGLYVSEGSYVRAGQTIGKIGGEKVDVNISQARANLESAQLALNRYEMAYKTGGVTALQLDQARLQVKNARAQLQSAQLAGGDTNVVAKTSGTVSKKMVEVGAVVGPGTPIVEIVNISSLKLRVEVDQALVANLHTGQNVAVKPDVISGTLDGRITFISPTASGALKFPVEITVANQGNQLRAGMYAVAIFDAGSQAPVLTIPREAFIGSISDGQVFQLAGSQVKLRKIETGRNFGDRVEVTSGLQTGDQVVTSGQINLQDNSRVTVLK